jgi:hypothetical protein
MSVKLRNAPKLQAAPLVRPAPLWSRLLPLAVFVLVLVGHALHIRHVAAAPVDGFADAGITDPGFLGLGPYLAAQDYFLGFSYALGVAFATWAGSQFLRQRRAALAAGAAGSIGMVGLLMASGCFLLGCCGSPMLGVYLALFGAKALGAGKPLMAGITLLSTGCGYWCLSRRFAMGGCVDGYCKE